LIFFCLSVDLEIYLISLPLELMCKAQEACDDQHSCLNCLILSSSSPSL